MCTGCSGLAAVPFCSGAEAIGCPILGDSKYGNNAANRELRLKYQALCAWELKFPAKISDERFAHLAGRVFHAEKPWYCQQVEDGTLK